MTISCQRWYFAWLMPHFGCVDTCVFFLLKYERVTIVISWSAKQKADFMDVPNRVCHSDLICMFGIYLNSKERHLYYITVEGGDHFCKPLTQLSAGPERAAGRRLRLGKRWGRGRRQPSAPQSAWAPARLPVSAPHCATGPLWRPGDSDPLYKTNKKKDLIPWHWKGFDVHRHITCVLPVILIFSKSCPDSHLACKTPAEHSKESVESRTLRRPCETGSGCKLWWWRPQLLQQRPALPLSAGTPGRRVQRSAGWCISHSNAWYYAAGRKWPHVSTDCGWWWIGPSWVQPLGASWRRYVAPPDGGSPELPWGCRKERTGTGGGADQLLCHRHPGKKKPHRALVENDVQ